MLTDANLLELTADIVSRYLTSNSVAPDAVPEIIRAVYGALQGVSSGPPAIAEPAAKQAPAVPIKKSIFPDYLICLDDGRKFKSLKRHLRAAYNLTPENYRAKWGLPKDYPMVAPEYAKARSDMAKAIGLGSYGQRNGPKPKAKVAPADA